MFECRTRSGVDGRTDDAEIFEAAAVDDASACAVVGQSRASWRAGPRAPVVTTTVYIGHRGTVVVVDAR